ncbi:MAG: hypothetical protein JW966_15475 [Anaerolineae bacterium]|nr:hypothetical protein [Anaerolineae bacterium]
MARDLNRVLFVILIAFGVVALSATFWAVVEADNILARPDNARNVIEEQRTRRGAILDRDGAPLATSQEHASGVMARVYPVPAAAAAVGYYSLTYGTAGIEAAYDPVLRGDENRDEWDQFVDDALHRAQEGSDVRSTIDLDVQLAAAEALGDRSGAVVAVHVPSGEVLAMVSQPGYDPNTLDDDWEQLTEDETTSPLLNRVTAGLYQPGGALQTVMLAAILASFPDLGAAGGYALNTEVPEAHEPITVNGLTLTCLPGTPDRVLTLGEAYAYGCPAPFVAALDNGLTPETLWERFQTVGLFDAPDLIDFQTMADRPPDALTVDTPSDVLRAAVVGQGDLTITPLQMALLVAEVANGGNGVPLHLADALRRPGSDGWQPVDISARQPAVLRQDVAEAVRLTMLQAAALSPYVSRARYGDRVLYGQCALAYAGPDATPYAWFAGFVDQTQGDQAAAIVVVVVVEDAPDPGAAADVARAAFAAATGD